jgi:hypothetical protein
MSRRPHSWRQSSPPARRRHSRPSRYRAQGTRPASCWRSDDPPPCIGPTCRRPRRGLATASGTLPLRLTWESAASPARICRRILIVEMDDGPVLPPGDAAAGGHRDESSPRPCDSATNWPDCSDGPGRSAARTGPIRPRARQRRRAQQRCRCGRQEGRGPDPPHADHLRASACAGRTTPLSLA